MWVTLALTALTAAPAQAGSLELKNDRFTYGILGAERKSSEFLPGDVVVLSYDIEGLKVKDDGTVLYSMSMEVTNKEGKSQFKNEPRDLQATNALGGSHVPAIAYSEMGTETPAGDYVMTVTVTDRQTNSTKKLSKAFQVVATKLGFVRTALSYDAANQMAAPPMAVPGQVLFFNFAVVGFKLDAKTRQPNLALEMRVIGEDGKPTVVKPFVGGATETTEAFKRIIPAQFVLELNRAGKYKVQIKGVDKVADSAAIEYSFDLTVVDAK
jgi:hypothetical protein